MIQRYRFVLEAIATVLIAGIIGVLIAFYGRIIGPKEQPTPVVINEVYFAYLANDPAPHQWIELYNNRVSEWMRLQGWRLETSQGQVRLPEMLLPPQGYAIVASSREQFLTDHPGYPGLVVSPLEAWPGLDPRNDFLILRNAQGDPVDALNWGQASGGPGDVRLWNNPAFAPGGGVPWLLNKDKTVRNDHSLERKVVGRDLDLPQDFMRQPFPSPGTVNPPATTRAAQLLLIDWTNVASFAGGILLWVAFVYVALIARRFEALTHQRTFWQAMLVAPSGILVYNIIQAYGFLSRGAMNDREKWWGFSFLFGSALLCTVLAYIFRRRARRILEG